MGMEPYLPRRDTFQKMGFMLLSAYRCIVRKLNAIRDYSLSTSIHKNILFYLFICFMKWIFRVEIHQNLWTFQKMVFWNDLGAFCFGKLVGTLFEIIYKGIFLDWYIRLKAKIKFFKVLEITCFSSSLRTSVTYFPNIKNNILF